MDFRRLSDLFIRSEPAFRINQVRREERVDQRRLSQTSLTCASQNNTSRQKTFDIQHSQLRRRLGGIRTNDDDVELETPFQELMLNLTRDGLETNVRVGADFIRLCLSHFYGGRVNEVREGNEWTWDGQQMATAADNTA